MRNGDGREETSQTGPGRRKQLPVSGLLRDPGALQLQRVSHERDLRLYNHADEAAARPGARLHGRRLRRQGADVPARGLYGIQGDAAGDPGNADPPDPVRQGDRPGVFHPGPGTTGDRGRRHHRYDRPPAGRGGDGGRHRLRGQGHDAARFSGDPDGRHDEGEDLRHRRRKGAFRRRTRAGRGDPRIDGGCLRQHSRRSRHRPQGSAAVDRAVRLHRRDPRPPGEHPQRENPRGDPAEFGTGEIEPRAGADPDRRGVRLRPGSLSSSGTRPRPPDVALQGI